MVRISHIITILKNKLQLFLEVYEFENVQSCLRGKHPVLPKRINAFKIIEHYEQKNVFNSPIFKYWNGSDNKM